VAARRNILLVASWYPSAADPVQGIFVEEQAVALSRSHRVAVIVPRLRRWRQGVVGTRGVERETRRGISVVRTDASPRIPKWPPATYSGVRRAVLRGYEGIRADWGTPDIVHAHVVRYAGWASLALADVLGVPAVLTEHSGPFDVHLRTTLDRTTVEQSLAAFAAVIAVSPVLKAEIQAVRSVPIDVIGNVIDTDFFVPADCSTRSAEPFKVLTASILTRAKRVDLVLTAVADLVRTETRRIELTVVGDGPERSALERLASNLKLRDVTRFVGVGDRATMRAEMQRADAFVLASEAETFGLVAGEAMACGTPVIVTMNGGSQYVVPDGLGIHVPVASSSAIAAAIQAVMHGTASIDVERARESIVRRFSPAAVVADLERVYDRVIGGRARPHPTPRSTAHPVS
jgi:glycosyltransferase involved in cell wall biosynthesis